MFEKWRILSNSIPFYFRLSTTAVSQVEKFVIADCQEKLSKLPPLFADNKGIFRVIFLSNLARENYCMKKVYLGIFRAQIEVINPFFFANL